MPGGRRKWWLRGWLAGLFLMACALRPVGAQVLAPVGEWWAYGADAANTKYSPLDQVTPANFRDLEIAWRLDIHIHRRHPAASGPPGESVQGHAADGGRTRLRQHGAGPGGGARGRNRRAGVVLRPPVLRTD